MDPSTLQRVHALNQELALYRAMGNHFAAAAVVREITTIVPRSESK